MIDFKCSTLSPSFQGSHLYIYQLYASEWFDVAAQCQLCLFDYGSAWEVKPAITSRDESQHNSKNNRKKAAPLAFEGTFDQFKANAIELLGVATRES